MKKNTLTIILVVIIIILLGYIAFKPKPTLAPVVPGETVENGQDKEVQDTSSTVKGTYIYTNHGFSIELPIGYTPKYFEGENGLYVEYEFPNSFMHYYKDALWFEKMYLRDLKYLRDQKVGLTTYKVYKLYKDYWYYFKQGNVAYVFTIGIEGDQDIKSFKFVGWPQIEGNKEDLVSFSIKPGQEVSGKMKVTGVLGGYYFEGSFPVQILDANKNKTSYGPGFATAQADWMTSKPVPFAADFDFSVMPKGKYYIKLMQDDPSDGANGFVSAYVLIPIVVK